MAMSRKLGIALAVPVLLVALIFGSIYGVGWVKQITADFRGETEQKEQTIADGSYRIVAYEHFFDLCAAVQTAEDSIASLEAELDTEPPQGRVTQINASITALRNSRADLINQYNADAAKEDTRAAFHSSDLPYQLDNDTEETTCAAPVTG